MAIVLSMIIFLLLFSSSKSMKTTCEISSVETGKDANLTIYFEDNLRNAASMDFIVLHVRDGSTESEMLSCRFTNGAAECDKTDCCTWEKQVTDVFHVYIHNVSQELEGKFWGVVLPAEGALHTYCNFSLKAPTCSSDSINATNSHKICNYQPVSIGKTCTVNCNAGYNFHDTQTSVTYICVGSNKWSPELPDRFCEYHSEDVKTNNNLYALTVLLIIPVLAILLIWKCFMKKRTRKAKQDRGLPLLDGTIYERDNHDQMHHGSENVLEWVKKWYPNFNSQTYFVPALYFIHVPYCMEKIAEKEELVPQSTEVAIASHRDVRDNRALQHVLNCIRTLSRNDHQKEVMFVVSQLQFQFHNYLGEHNFAKTAELLPRPSTLSEDLRQQHYDKVYFDILIIHREHGLFTLEISSVGEEFTQDEATLEKEDADLINNVKEVLQKLDRNERVLKHLTSDLQSGINSDLQSSINITKCLAIPNITSSQFQRAIKRDHLKELLCECLGVECADNAVKLCLLSNQISEEQKTPDVINSSSQTLEQWWQNVSSAPGAQPQMEPLLYEQLLARFCGPAMKVEVHCVTTPPLNIRTPDQAEYETGGRMVSHVLFPEQVNILNQSPPLAFLSGPPGTSKTFLLILQGLTWIQRGHDVYVVSTWNESRAATFLIEHQLQETTKALTAKSRVHRYQYNLMKEEGVNSAVRCLKHKSKDSQLCVIADTVVRYGKRFRQFCDQLKYKVPNVYIWGASIFHEDRPDILNEFKLTRSLRSPSVVTREVMEAWEIKKKNVHGYAIFDSVLTDGPAPIKIDHCDGQAGHKHVRPHNCVECGHQVAGILTKLNIGRTGNSKVSQPLKYSDVLVLCQDYPTDGPVKQNDKGSTDKKSKTTSGLIKGLRDSHVPVRVVKEGDEEAIRDTALHIGDLVTVANKNDVLGLERKVVIVESANDAFNERMYAMSLCMSQLVVINYMQS